MSDIKRILIVDDERDITDLLSSVLVEEGYQVMTASNGEEALKKIQIFTPHLILLDMNMPRMSGIDLYHHLYDSVRERAKFPVMFLTGRTEMEKVFRELRVDGFLTKPFDLNIVLSEVRAILARRYGNGAAARPAPHSTRHVLIVESDSASLGDITVAFLNAGYTVSYAGTAVGALEKIREHRPQAILIRMDLRDMPGDLLACKILQDGGPRMPILLYRCPEDGLQRKMTLDLCHKMGIRPPLQGSEPQRLLSACQEGIDSAKAA